MNPFYGLVSTKEAAELLNLTDDSSVRKAIASGFFIEGKECKKFGKQWVITVDALCRYQGNNQAMRRYKAEYGDDE